MYDEVAASCAFNFNKAAQTQDSFHELGRIASIAGSMLNVNRSGKPDKYVDVSIFVQEPSPRSPRKSVNKRSAHF
jgi:hypothetical protein